MADDGEPFEWSAYWDAEGNIYYYNSVTGESAWEAPEKFNPPPSKEEPAEEEAAAPQQAQGDETQLSEGVPGTLVVIDRGSHPLSAQKVGVKHLISTKTVQTRQGDETNAAKGVLGPHLDLACCTLVFPWRDLAQNVASCCPRASIDPADARACTPPRCSHTGLVAFCGIQANRPQFLLWGTIGNSFSPDSVSIMTFGPPLRGSGNARVTNPSGDQVGSSPRPTLRRFIPSLPTTQT